MAKFATLCETLEKKITSGIYAPGSPLPSIRSLVDQENISSATVQKSLKILHEKGFIEHHPNRGFFVSPSTKNVSSARNPHIGLVIGNANYQAEEFIRGAASVFDGSDYAISSFVAGNNPEKYDDYFDKIHKCKLSGILLSYLPSRFLFSHMEPFLHANVPLVLWGESIPGLVCDIVRTNFNMTGHIIAMRIIRKRYKNVRILMSPDRHPKEAEEFIKGFGDCLKSAGIEFTPEHVHYYESVHGYGRTYDSFIDSQNYIAGMIEKDSSIDAIVCCHENSAVGAIRAISEAKLRIPEDIAVISADRCAYLDPLVNRRITSFDRHQFIIGKCAAEMLLERLNGERTTPQIQLVGGEYIDGDTD